MRKTLVVEYTRGEHVVILRNHERIRLHSAWPSSTPRRVVSQPVFDQVRAQNPEFTFIEIPMSGQTSANALKKPAGARRMRAVNVGILGIVMVFIVWQAVSLGLH